MIHKKTEKKLMNNLRSSPPTGPTPRAKSCHKISENTITEFVPTW